MRSIHFGCATMAFRGSASPALHKLNASSYLGRTFVLVVGCLLSAGLAASPAVAQKTAAQYRAEAARLGRKTLLFHTMVGSNDIERSKRFYNAVLGALGVGEATLNVAGSGTRAARTLSCHSPSMTNRPPWQTAALWRFPATPQSRFNSFTTSRSPMAARQSKTCRVRASPQWG